MFLTFDVWLAETRVPRSLHPAGTGRAGPAGGRAAAAPL